MFTCPSCKHFKALSQLSRNTANSDPDSEETSLFQLWTPLALPLLVGFGLLTMYVQQWAGTGPQHSSYSGMVSRM